MSLKSFSWLQDWATSTFALWWLWGWRIINETPLFNNSNFDDWCHTSFYHSIHSFLSSQPMTRASLLAAFIPIWVSKKLDVSSFAHSMSGTMMWHQPKCGHIPRQPLAHLFRIPGRLLYVATVYSVASNCVKYPDCWLPEQVYELSSAASTMLGPSKTCCLVMVTIARLHEATNDLSKSLNFSSC